MFSITEYGNKRLRQSLFGHFFEKDETVCAYNALKIVTIYFPKQLFPYIAKIPGRTVNEIIRSVPSDCLSIFRETVTEICQASIYVPQEYDEITYLERIKSQIFVPPNPRVMVLHLTDYCNLRCRYCFIEGNIRPGYQRQNMSFKVVEKSLEKFGQMIEGKDFVQKPSIVFYGGEPLCNWPVIEHCLEYLVHLQEKNFIRRDMDKVIITNGTLATKKIAQTFKKHHVLPAVSIDGFREAHNANRIFRNGKGSFDQVIKGFFVLKEAGLKPTIASVLTDDNIPYIQEIIHWFLDELQVKALGFNHVSIVPDKNEYDPAYEDRAADVILKVQEIIQSFYPDVYERRMNRKLNCFLDREILKADCTGCGEQISISPNGQVGICQGYMGSRKTFNNTVFNKNFNPENDPVFEEWSRRSPLNMEQCYACPALGTCGGGCPRNADFIHGSIWQVDSAFCHFAVKAQEWMIWKKYEVSKK